MIICMSLARPLRPGEARALAQAADSINSDRLSNGGSMVTNLKRNDQRLVIQIEGSHRKKLKTSYYDVIDLVSDNGVWLPLSKPVEQTFINDVVITNRSAQLISPPEFGQYLLWYLPRSQREVVEGDLEEEFAIILDRFGRRKAVAWYYFQVFASFWPYAVRAGAKLMKWGVFGWLAEKVGRFIQ